MAVLLRQAKFFWMGCLWKGFPLESGGNIAERCLVSSRKAR